VNVRKIVERVVEGDVTPVRYCAHEVPGKGWTVAKVTGTKKTGKTVEPVPGYTDTYTMHQAQMAADALTRDTREEKISKKQEEYYANAFEEAWLGYLNSMIWTEEERWQNEIVDSGEEPVDDFSSLLDKESIKEAQKDISDFLADSRDILKNVTNFSQVGHDFWLTRNGHGAGFWDRPELYGGQENADKLTEIAREFGEVTSYLGDDGYFYFG
jgi:hypothetical protein